MGMNWKAMPLLSTLAALVIIVHSAEEDFEPDYRELRPRRFDTVTTNYDQPWRALDMEPAATPVTQADWGFNLQDEPMKYRRPGRKRKRRPLPTPEEDLIPQERHVLQEEYRPYKHETLNTQPRVFRRRRKQFDTRQPERANAWGDETVDADRPLIRRRGSKRKRPPAEDTWPELVEFSGIRQNDNAKNINSDYVQPTESTWDEGNNNYDDSGKMIKKDNDTIIKYESDEPYPVKYNSYEAESYNNEDNHYSEADDTGISSHKTNEDESLSEFSLEIQPPGEDIKNSYDKLSDKAVNTFDGVEKIKNNETLDAQTLKQILKKSNGRSLSEILQQHNLSLVDLLHGKEKAISILTEEPPRNDSGVVRDELTKVNKENKRVRSDSIGISKQSKGYQNRNIELKPLASASNTLIIRNINGQSVISTPSPDVSESVTEITTTKPSTYKELEQVKVTEKSFEKLLNHEENPETTTKSSLRRRFPVSGRRRLRMRPMNNTTFKSQLNRDMISLTSRRYQLSRNTSRSREWKDVMPTSVKIPRKDVVKLQAAKVLENHITTTTFTPNDITVLYTFEDIKSSTLPDITESDISTTNTEIDNTPTESAESITTTDFAAVDIPTTVTTTPLIDIIPTTTITTTSTRTTEKPIDKTVSRPAVKASDLRRQAFNNRLKRKRLKHKTTTTETNQEYAMKDIFGMANLVSASEFIAKAQPRTTSNEEDFDFTTLEDFITTESTFKSQSKQNSEKTAKAKYFSTNLNLPTQDMEETAKIEIEEMLNDTRTSARLSKILMERNMTINELVEHRERGSSHIHLADIFHNASREPNPPEPFLSKSLIEPISKETYPLRALLEANLHDPTAKAITLESNSTHSSNINIPVVMDFGNNVNENGENMGIMSLFDNFTKFIQTDTDFKQTTSKPLEVTSHVPEHDDENKYGTSRESRTINADKDLVTWKEIIAIMQRGQKNNTNEDLELTTKDISPALVLKKIVLDDLDDDDSSSKIIVNDLHHHTNLDSHLSSSSPSSDENTAHHLRENTELPQIHGVPRNTSNSAKSVTVATASIIGLAMVLFLLTYVVFRWKQQRSLFREKETLTRGRIPTPVFETRKSHKINSSTRSKSPMISQSNIYSIEASDMRNGNDSPEYMWDSLRKPFQ